MPPKGARRVATTASAVSRTTAEKKYAHQVDGAAAERAPGTALSTADSGYHTQPDYPSPQSDQDTNASGSLDLLGRRVNKLVGSINRLESLGVGQRFEIPLPKIVVVGDQSTGKSSQVEALSDIKVPRASGTCTRCVLHISLKTGDSATTWTCKVSLHLQFMFVPDHPEAVTSDFGPWFKAEQPDTINFATVSNKADLGITMKRAQLALLNPSKDPREFRKASANAPKQINFSPNVVHLEITAPNVPSLSFYDLPGVISQSEYGDEPYLVELIKGLAEIYIEEANTIVMLTRAMNSDVSTSAAGRLIQDLEAKDRTIGVLTKPDRLEVGGLEQWRPLLAGAAHPFALGHGYYVTRQPSQDELNHGISQADARRNEDDFFSHNAPWNSQLAQYRTQFGTTNLRDRLSQLLAQQIAEALPYIESKIQQKLTAVDRRLLELPKPQANNSFAIVTTLIERLSHELDSVFAGDNRPDDEQSIGSDWKKAVEHFRTSILGSRPVVLVRAGEPEPGWSQHMHSRARPIAIDEDEGPPSTPTPNRKRAIAPPSSTASKRPRIDTSATPTPGNSAGKASKSSGVPVKEELPARPKKKHRQADHNGAALGKTFPLDVLRSELDKRTASNVADEVDSRAKEKLMRHSMTHWDPLLEKYKRDVLSLLRSVVDRVVTEYLRIHSGTMLAAEMVKVVEQSLDTLATEFDTTMQRALQIELNKPTTFNVEARRRYRDREYEQIAAQRRRTRAAHFIAYTTHREPKELHKLSGNDLDTERNQRAIVKREAERLLADTSKHNELLSQDPYQREINVIADIRAYYFVAADAFIDNVAKMTEFCLFSKCTEELVKLARKQLKLHDESGFEYAKMLLAEDAERERERCNLEIEKTQLMKALETLEGLAGEDEEMRDADDDDEAAV